MTKKTCTMCRREYPLDCYGMLKRNGRTSWCRLCLATMTAIQRYGWSYRQAKAVITTWRDRGWRAPHPHHNLPTIRHSNTPIDPYRPAAEVVGPGWMRCQECSRRLHVADFVNPRQGRNVLVIIRVCRLCERMLRNSDGWAKRYGLCKVAGRKRVRRKIRAWVRKGYQGMHPQELAMMARYGEPVGPSAIYGRPE